MLEQILTITLPVFSIVFIGYLYGRFDNHDLDVTNKINMDIFLPALLLFILSEKISELQYVTDIFYATLIVVIGSGLITWLLCKLLHIPITTLVPPMMFNNCGNLGLPLAIFAFGEQALPLFIIAFVTSNTLHFSVGIWLVTGHFNANTFLKNPVFIASVAGLMLNITGTHVPAMVLPGLEMLAAVSIPLMLATLGIKFANIKLSNMGIGIMAAVLAPVVGLITAFVAIWLLDLNAEMTRVMLLFCILPPAVLNYLFAERYRQQPDQAASIVVIGNLFSVISVPLILSFIL